jgi:hypothetical protein
VNHILAIFATCVHHYLVQRDLLFITIESRTVMRQQEQLTQYFMKTQDPVIVAYPTNDDIKVLFQNPPVRLTLGVSMLQDANETSNFAASENVTCQKTQIFEFRETLEDNGSR